MYFKRHGNNFIVSPSYSWPPYHYQHSDKSTGPGSRLARVLGVSRINLSRNLISNINPGPHFSQAAGRKLLKFFQSLFILASVKTIPGIALCVGTIIHSWKRLVSEEQRLLPFSSKNTQWPLFHHVDSVNGPLIYPDYKMFDLCYNLMSPIVPVAG